jgi:hypothetical protein
VCLVVFSSNKERRRNKDSAGINRGIVLGRSNIQIMASESEKCVIARISASHVLNRSIIANTECENLPKESGESMEKQTSITLVSG